MTTTRDEITQDSGLRTQHSVLAAWELTNPPTPYDLWTRTNVGEVFPNAVTPLTWSLYWLITQETWLVDPSRLQLLPRDLFRDGQPPLMIGAINGWLFFNTGLIYHIVTERFGLPSWFYSLSLGGPQEGEKLGLPPRDARPWTIARSLPLLLKEQRRLGGIVEQFRRTAAAMRDDARRLRAQDVDTLELPALLRRLDAVGERSGPPNVQLFEGSAAALNSYGVLAALTERWCGDRALANDLVTGLANLLTAQASISLWQVAGAARGNAAARRIIETAPPAEIRSRLRESPETAPVALALDRFFAHHGHRATDEFELAVPRWSDDPTFVVATLRTYLNAPPEADPARHLERQRALRAAAERRAKQLATRGTLGRLLPWRWLVLRGVLRQTRRYLPMRENPKYHFLLYVAEMRRTALAIGRGLQALGAIEHGDDVFFLTRAELDRGAGGTDLHSLVAGRRAMYERFAAWKPPDVIRGRDVSAVEAALLDGVATPTTPAIVEQAIETPGPAPAGRLAGIAASAGVVTGRVRVALTPEEGSEIEPGEILVAPFTDPGWTPLFIVAGAIVMDLGGLLSHGAIVAREYGIPAVVNTRTATATLKTGQQVTVDGTTGAVTWE